MTYAKKENQTFRKQPRPNRPSHNKLRLVYRVDKFGRVASFIYVEREEGKRIMAMLKYLEKKFDEQPDPKKRYVTVRHMMKDLNLNQRTLQLTLKTMAGVKWYDMQERSGRYIKLSDQFFDVTKKMIHPKTNLPNCPKYIKASLLCRPCAA